MSGCLTNTKGKTPSSQKIEELTQEISDRKYSVDEALLVECQWFVLYSALDLVSVEQVHRENAERFRECYIIHNSLVETLRSINAKN